MQPEKEMLNAFSYCPELAAPLAAHLDIKDNSCLKLDLLKGYQAVPG